MRHTALLGFILLGCLAVRGEGERPREAEGQGQGLQEMLLGQGLGGAASVRHAAHRQQAQAHAQQQLAAAQGPPAVTHPTKVVAAHSAKAAAAAHPAAARAMAGRVSTPLHFSFDKMGLAPVKYRSPYEREANAEDSVFDPTLDPDNVGDHEPLENTKADWWSDGGQWWQHTRKNAWGV